MMKCEWCDGKAETKWQWPSDAFRLADRALELPRPAATKGE